METPVAIVGAGPTGIACAVELGRRGIPAGLLRPRRAPRLDLPLPRGDALVLDARSPRHRGRSLRLAGGSSDPARDARLLPRRGRALRRSRSVRRPRSSGSSRGPAGASSSRPRRRVGPERFEAPAAILATGFFHNPRRLGVPGDELPHVHARYVSGYPFHGRDVVVVGGKNSAAEAALDLYRHGARVTMVVRAAALSEKVKYWIKPDLENRIAAGAIRAHFGARVVAIENRRRSPRRRPRASGSSGGGGLPADRLRAGLRPLRALRHPARGRGPGPGARSGDAGIERPRPLSGGGDPERPRDGEDLHREQPAPRGDDRGGHRAEAAGRGGVGLQPGALRPCSTGRRRA